MNRNNQDDEKQELVPINGVSAVDAQFRSLHAAATILPPRGLTSKEKKRYVGSGVLAFLSGILYFFSSLKAAERYVGYAKDTSSYSDIQWLQYLPALGGGVTNALFNAESYLTVYESLFDTQEEKKRKQGLGQGVLEKWEWFATIFIAFFTILPVWKISLEGDTWEVVLATVSAVLNVPVTMEGAKALIDWLKEYDFKDRVSNCLHFVRSEIGERSPTTRVDAQEAFKINQVTRQARNLIAHFLKEQAGWFSSASGEVRKTKRGEFFSNINASSMNVGLGLNVFSELIKNKIDFVPPSHSFGYRFLARTTFSLLAFCGVVANVGYAGLTYQGGLALIDNVFFGWLSAILHLIPSIGFTIKGIQSLWGTLQEIEQSTCVLERIELPKMYLTWCVVSTVFALFSGFTGDGAGYETWMDYFSAWGGETMAIVMGIIHNIGIALVYNLPQCLYFAQRMVDLYILKTRDKEIDDNVRSDVQFVNGLKETARLIRRMPLTLFSNFLEQSRGTLRNELFVSLNLIMGEENVDYLPGYLSRGMEYQG